MTSVNPTISTRSDGGVFLAYNNYMLNQEILLWFSQSGTLERGDTVDIPNVDFSYAEGTQGKLVSYVTNPFTLTETFVVHTYNHDGTYEGQDTLIHLALADDEIHAGHAYEYSQGTLTLATSLVHQSASPLLYSMRLVRYSGGVVTVHDAWDPGPVPVGSHIANWSVTQGPGDCRVLGFYVKDSQMISQLRFEAVDSAGVASPLQYVIPLPPYPEEVFLNGLDLIVANATVYPEFSMNSVDSSNRGGVFLAAFPLSELLSSPDRSHVVPQNLSLTAYPNPFNSSVRLEYQLGTVGMIRLQVFDVSGRLVCEKQQAAESSGNGMFLWSASGLSSGIYLARLSGGNAHLTSKLFLIR